MVPTISCSVVIPTYNGAHLIGDQLEALRSQVGAGPFEIVVSDNASTDELHEVIRAWKDRLPRLRVVDASRAKGVSAARNVGIEHAMSDRILICDCDDVVSLGWVAALSEALESSPLVTGPLETVRLSGRSAQWVPIPELTDGLLSTWDGRTYGAGGNTGMLRQVWSEVGGYDEDYPAGAEEIDFAWRAADLGYQFAFVPEAVLHYRIRTDLRGVLRQQFNSGRGVTTLASKVHPGEVRPKSLPRRVHHEMMLLRQFPLMGSSDERRRWLCRIAFEAGKLVEAKSRGVPAP